MSGRIALVLAVSFLTAATARGQSQPSVAPDSVVAIVAAAEGLPLLPPDQAPPYGTFWSVRSSYPCVFVPLPFPPWDPSTPVYAVAGNHYLVDETGGQVISPEAQYPRRLPSGATVASLLQAQVEELQSLVAEIREWQTRLQLSGQSGLLAGAGSGSPGGDSGGMFYGPPPPATNDLRLDIISFSASNATANLCIHPPWYVTNGVYDLFSTTNLGPAWWELVLRTLPGQTNLTLTNMPLPMEFFILGLTNDTDGGGVSDAYEGLLGLNTADPNDDQTNPIVRIAVTDSLAIEQESTNTAAFSITRLGGHMKWPLVVPLQLSGTATQGVNYSLSLVTVTSSNVLVTIPSNQTSVTVTLTPMDDHVADGTKTATLTIQAGAGWQVDSAHESATAWILEQYTRTYTTVADFSQGVMDGLEAMTNNDDGHLEFKTNLPPQFPFIAVACSGRGTVARINTTNGQVIGEYRTAPDGLIFTGDSGSGPQPSRTTVDLFGNVWVANRADDFAIDRSTNGSITRIGLIIGPRFSKTNDTYYPDPQGHYISVSNAAYNTCTDRDGDGYICTSAGLADILPWTNQRAGLSDADSRGGVSTAEDEAITEYVRVGCTGTRTIAVDRFNDIWVGGRHGRQEHLKVNGLTGAPVPNSVFAPRAGGYGGVIDSLGALWSTSTDSQPVLRLVPPAAMPPTTNDWRGLVTSDNTTDSGFYGIAVDPVHPYIWQTVRDNNYVFRWHTNGTPVTNANGTLQTNWHGGDKAQGLTVDALGHVWVAHGPGATTVGHLDTNGLHLGNVTLRPPRLRADYFANTNLAGIPALTRLEAPIDFDWGAGSPDPVIPTNYFSVRWSGVVTSTVNAYAEFFVSADAGAGSRLTVGGSLVIENWDNPAPDPGELSGTGFLSAGENDLVLIYKEFTGDARVRLSWIEPGTTNKVVIPPERLNGPRLVNASPTGVSVDFQGNIWAANQNSNSVVRINPNAGEVVVTNGVTNYVGEVDMVVDLGDGSQHPAPYDLAAAPYNYSDMTGFNNRIVNPGLQPLKGYWTVINDSGLTNEIWERVAWSDDLPIAGCSVEVFVRAADDRQSLANQPFIPASNDVPLASVQGRYIEVRVGITRDAAAKQPMLYDLTLVGNSSGLVGTHYLEPAAAFESEEAQFWTDLVGPEPVTYRWEVLYPWVDEWAVLAGQTNWLMVWPNADQWEDGSWVRVTVSNAAGQSLQLGPSPLSVYPLAITIPGSLTNSMGPASRYPATIHVRGEPTNGLSRVEVTLLSLRHAYAADLDILLVSPSGKKIMLMSDAGSSFAVTNATLVFGPSWQDYAFPPEQTPIPSGQVSDFWISNYGDQESALPGAPPGPYIDTLDALPTTDSNPNGIWELYIYDDKSGQTGVLQDSWTLQFYH